MTEKGLDALTRLRDLRRPLKIHHSTGQKLLQDGLVTRAPNGYWVITKAGISCIDRWENRERMEAIQRRVWRTKDAGEVHQHARDWLVVHARLTTQAKLYVSHVLDALLTDEPILPSGNAWEAGGDELCRAWAEVALDAVREIRRVQVEAHEAGGDLIASYEVGPKVERRAGDRRGATVERATVVENVVSMDRYLAERRSG